MESTSGDRRHQKVHDLTDLLMDLLFVSNDFPKPFQPTEAVFNLNLVRALSVRHEVRVISPVPWVTEVMARNDGTWIMPPGRKESTGGFEAHYPRYYYVPKVMRGSYGSFYWWSVRRKMCELLGRRSPDTVLAYWAHPDGEVAARIGRMAGIPSAVIVGGSDVLLLPRDRVRRPHVLKALGAVDIIIAVSEYLRDKVIELGVDPDKVHVWSQGVDETLFRPGERAGARKRLGISAEQRALVWVGRMVPVKGLDVMLAACSELAQGCTDFHLYLVGDGPLRPALEVETRTRGLTDRVTFVGSRMYEELPDWYRSADLTVLPSRSEGLPNVLRESVACGTPFIASRVGGVSEIAGGGVGRLVPPCDPVALAGAISGMLDEKPGGQSWPRSTSWAESAESLVQILATRLGAGSGMREGEELADEARG